MDKKKSSKSTVGNADSSKKDKSKDSKDKKKIVRNEPPPSELLDEADVEPESSGFECPVCLQSACFPVELPCHHIFCYLCVKGFANRSKRCALCRQIIPADFLYDPKLVCEDEIKEKSMRMYDNGYQWFYEGRHGWWQYDERTSSELESHHKNGDKNFELLIAGFLYVIDLETMRQFRRTDPTRRRNIRRDLVSISGVKGIAGLKYDASSYVRPSADGGNDDQSGGANGSNSNAPNPATARSSQSTTVIMPQQSGDSSGNGGDGDSYLTPPAPNNTPQTPMTPADSQPGSLSGSQEDLSLNFPHLNINSNGSSRDSPVLDQFNSARYDSGPWSHPDNSQADGDDDDDDDGNDRDGTSVDSLPVHSRNAVNAAAADDDSDDGHRQYTPDGDNDGDEDNGPDNQSNDSGSDPRTRGDSGLRRRSSRRHETQL